MSRLYYEGKNNPRLHQDDANNTNINIISIFSGIVQRIKNWIKKGAIPTNFVVYTANDTTDELNSILERVEKRFNGYNFEISAEYVVTDDVTDIIVTIEDKKFKATKTSIEDTLTYWDLDQRSI